MSKLACLIPARMGSSRFPGKPMTMISGQTMIGRVASNVSAAMGAANTFVVTDSPVIVEAAADVGVKSILATGDFSTGTDRISSIADRFAEYDWVFNVQGDEPLLAAGTIRNFVHQTLSSSCPVTNAYTHSRDYKRVESVNSIKMAISAPSRLIYASRGRIPFDSEMREPSFALQVCIYGFKPEALVVFGNTGRAEGTLEERENIEILRFIEMGVAVEMIQVQTNSHPVDIPEDVQIVERLLKG